MDTSDLPLTPGSTTAILHPFNLLHVSYAILRHALSAFNPDTAVVRRTHHRSRSHAGATESRFAAERRDAAGDTASVASSHPSRRSRRSGDAEPSSNRPHWRRSSNSGDSAAAAAGQRRRHRSSGEGDRSSREAGERVPAVSSSRRTRSAEEPLVVARRASTGGGSSTVSSELGSSGGRVRRSHSDGVRSRTQILLGDETELRSDSTRTNDRVAFSASRPPPAAATAARASSLTPPLAPPPPVTDIGKPPLSSRRLSSSHTAASAADGETRLRHRHHRSGSGGGLSSSSRRSSRSRRSENGDDTDDADSNVIIVRDGEAGRLASAVSAWSLRSWWRRTRARNITRQAYLIDHVIHAVPVAIVHYCCELKRQLVTLPLLRFNDLLPSPGAAGTCGATGSGPADAAAPGWLPTEERFEKLPAPHVAHLLLMRWILAATASYIEKFFFDESLVVRQLRSKRTPRRLLGWGLRLASHTVFDPLLLSVVVPMLLSWGATPEDVDASSLLPSSPPRLLFTVPGVVRGLVMSAAGVAIQRLMMPIASQLVDRAVLTVFEAVEYLIMRRYARWSDDDEDDGYHEDDEGEDDRVSLASGVSEGARSQQSLSTPAAVPAPSGDKAGGTAAFSAEKRVEREQRQLRRERRERRKRRERRQAEREHAMRLAILRAIVYRVVASLAAQSLIDHPLSVLVELLRGRATLHFAGLLQPYTAMTTACDGLSWANLWRHASQLAGPAVVTRGAGNRGDADEGVPPMVKVLRRTGRAITQEVVMLTASVLVVSGQTEAIAAVQRRAAQTVAQGGIPSAADSADFMACTLSSLSPFYYGIQFTVIDKVLSFYMAVWTRLTKQ
ncbi:hypothetical protein LSCM1_00860 [Leishmania martiniquensis]|uniref:Uncharacterized protein n=1 Tax=Leishmania martiniquensis TaxID=1580590 RepID=A0A836GXM9_9TRYP|nr:hypothetical protein LSCM1_00860 [Leishmania martiniquensis]